MPVDLSMLGSKVKRLREQLQLSCEEISDSSGIDLCRLKGIEDGKIVPTGDEILIISDILRCDYNYFISNDKFAPIEQTDILFRRHGSQLNKPDRMAVQEVLFMAECEHFLQTQLNFEVKIFNVSTVGNYYIGHAIKAAADLRRHLSYKENIVGMDVFDDIRHMGFHLFRRRLDNSNISGISILHPLAGRCVLVNYNEDLYRQRFTAMHEVAHCLFDLSEGVYLSLDKKYIKDKEDDLKETRANYFASNFLVPPEFVERIPENKTWDNEKIKKWAQNLKVNPQTLAIALKNSGKIDSHQCSSFSLLKLVKRDKTDVELSSGLSAAGRNIRESLLSKGLSYGYVKLCFDAYMHGLVTLSRISEMLLTNENEIEKIKILFGVSYD